MASKFRTKPTKRQLMAAAASRELKAAIQQLNGLQILLQINEFHFGKLPKELPELVMSVLRGEQNLAAQLKVPFTDNDVRRHIWATVSDFAAAQVEAVADEPVSAGAEVSNG